MPVFPQVFARLQEDDSVLVMSDTEFLEVELSEALTRDRIRGDDDRTPCALLRHAGVFVHQLLHRAAEEVAGKPYLPDPRNPNGFCRFKMSDDVVVAFHGDSPVWFWRRNGGSWELHMMRVTKESDLEDTEDIDALLAAFENAAFENYDEEEDDTDTLLESTDSDVGLSDDEPEIPDVDEPQDNDPERLTPDPLLGVLQHFTRVLTDAHAQLKGAPLLPDPTDPNGERRFRSNGEFIVAYRVSEGAKDKPIWCWRKKQDGHWKLYRLRTCAGMEIPSPSFEKRLWDGNWD